MSRSIDPMAQHKAGCGLSRRAPRPHRCDESAAGYSLVGCSPAEPASASPDELIMPPLGWIRYPFSVNRDPSLLSWPRHRGPLQKLCALTPGFHPQLGQFGGGQFRGGAPGSGVTSARQDGEGEQSRESGGGYRAPRAKVQEMSKAMGTGVGTGAWSRGQRGLFALRRCEVLGGWGSAFATIHA